MYIFYKAYRMDLLYFGKSNRFLKKYMVVVQYGNHHKTIHFGQKGYRDYTTMPEDKADNAKTLYISRHQRRERWDDPLTSGYWARWVLWNKRDLTASLKDAINKMNALNI